MALLTENLREDDKEVNSMNTQRQVFAHNVCDSDDRLLRL